MDYLAHTLQWFSELLWPARCVGCGVLGVDLCAPCLRAVKPLRMQSCPGCHRPNSLGIPCPGCRGRTHIDRLIAVAAMVGTVEMAIYALKYRSMRQIATPLGDWAASVVGLRPGTASMFGTNPVIVPVPLHPARLRERGYNQAALVAHRLAIAAAMPLADGALARARHTGSQVKTQSRVERLDNMRDAFMVAQPHDIDDRDVIIIDDVCTTGATLEDCARALKAAGARTVSAIVLAHG